MEFSDREPSRVETGKNVERPLVLPQIISIIGPELSGKSTQAEILSKRANLPLVKMGEMFRMLQNEDSDLGKRCKELQSRGGYSDAGLFREVFLWGLEKDKDKYQYGFIIEGAPRTLDQFQEFPNIISEILKDVDLPIKMVYLNMTRKRAHERIKTRPPRKDDAQLDIRLDEHFLNLAEKIKTAKGYAQLSVVSTIHREKGEVVSDKNYREVNEAMIEKLGIDETQIRTYREAFLSDENREVTDFSERSMQDIGHDIATLPQSQKESAINAYIKAVNETLSESFGAELAEYLLGIKEYLEFKLYEVTSI